MKKTSFSMRILTVLFVGIFSFVGCKGKNSQSPLTALLPIALLGGSSSSSGSSDGSSSSTTATTETAPTNLVFTAGSTGTNTANFILTTTLLAPIAFTLVYPTSGNLAFPVTIVLPQQSRFLLRM